MSQRKKNRLENAKGILRTAESLLEVIVLTVAYYIVWRNGYEEGVFPPYQFNGKYVLMGVYALLVLVLFSNTDGFQFGNLRMMELSLAQCIGLFIINFVTYFQLCLIANHMVTPVPLLILMAVDLVLCVVFIYGYTWIYHRLYAPHNMLMIYGSRGSVALKLNVPVEEMEKLADYSTELEFSSVCAVLSATSINKFKNRYPIGQIIGEGLTTHKFFKPRDPQMKEYILDIMEQCGLQDYMLHRYPHQFSGGQRQRICIARALAVKPKFIVCDECVSALDVSIQSQIINLLEELKEKENLTYLFISHDLSVVRYISDRIGVMYLGNMVEMGTAEELFNDPRHPYTVALLSSIPTTDVDAVKKERIILEGNIPSPIKPPDGCKFHTRCYMACEKCRRVPPELQEVSPGHYMACHFPEKKLDENGNYLFKMPVKENKE